MMSKFVKKLGSATFVALIAAGAYALLAPNAAFAGKGNGKGGGGSEPPACGCAEVIVLPDGTPCFLEDCGFDCVYVCAL